MTGSRTHFRKVYKSDHLGVVDLEEYTENGSNLVFTIKHTKQEYGARVAGRKIDCNIAYFVEDIKPMVLNATNAKQIRDFVGSPIVEDWNNVTIQLYIDSSVKMKGETVGGIRIRPKQPRAELPLLDENHPHWAKASAAIIAKQKTISEIKKHYRMTDEVYKRLCTQM